MEAKKSKKNSDLKAVVELQSKKATNKVPMQHNRVLRKPDAYLQALLNNTLQAFILLDANYLVIAVNKVAHKTFKNIFGKKIEVGDSFKHLLSKDLSLYFSDEIEQALKGKVIIREKEIKTASGKTYGFMMNCTPVLDEYKKVQALSFSLLDISELKKTKHELIKTQDLVNSVFHTADIGIAVIDENGTYIKTNNGYNKLFGYNANELNGKQCAVTVPADGKKEYLAVFKSLFSAKAKNEERVGIKKNGEIINIYRTANLLVNADGSRYLVVTSRDISETKKYRQLLQHAERITHMAGWEMDIPSKKVTCTEELYNILEITRHDYNKMSFERRLNRFYDAATRPLIKNSIEEAITKGKSFDLEVRIRSATKKRKWLAISCTPERLNSKTVKLRGTLQDITPRKEVEIEMERLSLVASKTNNAVFITDAGGKILWVNDSVEKITGYTKADMLGNKPGDILQGRDTDKHTVSMISKQLKKREPVTAVIKNYKKDGTAFWVNMDIAPSFKNGVFEHFIGIVVDISDLVKAKEEQKARNALEQQQKLFDAIARNFPDGIIGVLDRNFHYVFAGGTEIKKLGLSVQDFIGANIFDHISESNNNYALPFLQKAILGEQVTFEVEIRKNFYSVNAVPMLGSSEEDIQILVVLYNITNRKKAEKDLREALNKERELGELKSRFVSMASHEFRTPLSTVLSSAYLIGKFAKENEQIQRERHLQRIVSSVEMLTDILNDFLSLGKIEEGKILVKFTQFNIQELINDVTDEMKNNLLNEQEIIYRHTGNSTVLLDRSLLKHIVMNLLTNASKFSPEKGKIEIITRSRMGKMILSVKDRGIGISAEDQKHLMERFFRGANAGNIKGTGLGLHIVSKYADLMHGTLTCKSELDKGSEFIVTMRIKND